MEFFEKIFDGLTDLSAKMPAIEVKAIFIIAMCSIAGIGIILGLTFLGAKAFKMKGACSRIVKYLADVEAVNDDNVEDFTSKCFGKKAPTTLGGTWNQYVGIRYGFPSEVVTEQDVFDKEVKRASYWRANLFIGLALVVTALLAFWGLALVSAVEMGVILGIGVLLAVVVYIILMVIGHQEYKQARKAFESMQDDLDAKVNFDLETSFAADGSPLAEMAAVIDDIIARNEAGKEEAVEEEYAEAEYVEEPVEEYAEEPVEEYVEEPVQEEGLEEEPAEEEYVQAEIEDLVDEELVEESVEDATADVEEAEEDEEDMFGRRKKAREEAAQIPQEERAFLESEVVDEEEREYLDSEVVDDEVPENQEIVEEEENLDEGDEEVKEPKLAKLPNLMDYIMSKNLSTKAKMSVAIAMVNLCAKFKNDPENFKLAKRSTAKVLTGIVRDKIAEKNARG